ncbi:MAG TPA: pilus assembly protein TadG-related protein [Candidatus Limnocylindria bacterium]|nr:pilus assembly protein TadG-related protein [Candidatus Limnocylindria bacterium]
MITRSALREFFGPHGQGGQAVVLIAITMTAMLFAVGLAIDAGQLFVAKRSMQEAADAAAFAGAVVIYQTPGADPRPAAMNDAAANGYVDGVANTTITYDWPPRTGPHANNTKYIEVTIVQLVPTSLVPAQSTLNSVRARSVAGADPAKSPFAIVALKSTGPCITLAGTGSVMVPDGPDLGGMIQANCSGTSVQFGGAGSIYDNLGVRTVGTVSNPLRVVPNAGLQQQAPKQPDPFAGFPKPSVTGLPTFGPGFTVPSSACNPATPLTPGVYVGGITNDQNCNVYLGSGVFILKGGGLRQNASAGYKITTVPGGAMLFNTHSNYPGPIGSGTCGGNGLAAEQGGGVDIWAMTTGLYAGMAYYQDAACTATIAVQSNGGYNFHGTFYAPSALIDLQSQSALTVDAQLVVSAINFQSSGNLTVNYHKSLSANSGLPTIVE